MVKLDIEENAFHYLLSLFPIHLNVIFRANRVSYIHTSAELFQGMKKRTP